MRRSIKNRFSSTALVTVTALSASLFSGAVSADVSRTDHQPARSFAGAFLAAETARQDNDFTAAARYFEEALSYDQGNQTIERGLLIALLTDGRFEDAISIAERLTDEPSISPTAFLTLGVDAMRAESYDTAHDLLSSTARADLERLIKTVMRGWTMQAQGDLDGALATVNDLVGPDWFNLFKAYHSGLMAQISGDADVAREFFNGALANRAGGGASPLTYLRLAQASARLELMSDDEAAALDAIDRGLDLAPTNPALLTLRETIDGSSARLPLIANAREGAAEILLNLGSAINRDGSESFAALYIELARALAPDSDNIAFELGSIAERLDQPERAIAYYDLVAENSPLRRVASLQQGLNLADLDRTEEAVAELEGLVEENPADYRGYLALGGIYSSERDWENAAAVYERALENINNDEPSYWPLHYRLAIAYERMKEWEKAEPRFLKALELSPDRPDVLNYLGYSWVDMNMNLERGLEMIRKAVELRPRAGYIVDSLGWAYYRLGRFDEAVDQLERAAELEPRDPTINDHLGDAYWRVGRRLEATYQWSTSLDFEPEDDLRAKIEAKLDAANTAGVLPEIAIAISDDESAAQQASDGG
ncbi:MAG: tetratricopeptide repeat protein [Pseudomonadota bacterium]